MAEQAEVKMCDKFPEEVAVAMYAWPWGEKGYCSQRGQQILRQTAKNLKREVEFLPLPVNPDAQPMKRSERQRLISEKLAAESECQETAERCSTLYDNNVTLNAELTRVRTLLEAKEVEAKGLKEDLDEANKQAVAEKKRSTDYSKKLIAAETVAAAAPSTQAVEEINSLRGQVEALNKRIADSEAEVGKRQALLEESSGRVKELEEALTRSAGAKSELQTQLMAANEKIAALES